MTTPTRPSLTFPPNSIDLQNDLVPAIRSLLRKGLSDEFQRSCVRVGSYQAYGGGLKSNMVGALNIHVAAVLKLGGRDLALHEQLMNAVNAHYGPTFPIVLDRIEIDHLRQLLIMEDLGKYRTLLDLIYVDKLPAGAIARIVEKAIDALVRVRLLGAKHRDSVTAVPATTDPFIPRLKTKLQEVIAADPELEPLLRLPGRAMGLPCPPLNEVIESLSRAWRCQCCLQRQLQHGDSHLANIMVRRYGKGWSVRLIDPNPEIGFADPYYDVGKLLHWAEPVGWAKAAPQNCRGTWSTSRAEWQLDADFKPTSRLSELNRTALLSSLYAQFPRLLPTIVDARRLALAAGSAHIGLAALLKSESQQSVRRFVLAHSLRRLLESCETAAQ